MNKEPYLEASKALRLLCKSFFDRSEVDFFGYARFYKDRRYEFVFSHDGILNEYLDKQFYLQQFGYRELKDFSTGFIYEEYDVGSDTPLEMLRDVEEKFGVSHFLSYQEKHKDYCDFFSFGAHKSKTKFVEVYLSQLPFLKKFSQLGLPTFRQLIDETNFPKISIPFMEEGDQKKAHKLTTDQSLKLLVDIIQRTNAEDEGEAVHITQREIDCIKYLIGNKTAKETARALDISHRTVEHHYDRLKLKLELPTKTALKRLFSFEE